MSADNVRPLTRKQREELKGYISRSTEWFRAFVFMLALGIALLLARVANAILVAIVPSIRDDLWWVAAVLLVGVAVFLIARHWSGEKTFRANVRKDLAEGVVTVWPIVAVEAIEVAEGEDEGPSYFILTGEVPSSPEGEDEGPSYFILTGDGRTALLWGQYLERYKRRGFPWTEFEILEAPHSRTFFGLVRVGDKLEPSLRRGPLSWEEFKRYGDMNADYQFIDAEFDVLKKDFAALGRDN